MCNRTTGILPRLHISKMANSGWQIDKSLSDCMHHVLESEMDCDVKFTFPSHNPPAHLSSHRLVLKSRSPVFEAMFSGAFIEAVQDVKIEDIEPDVFKEMLRFIYTDKVEVTADNVFPLMFAAKKYLLDQLQAHCSKFLTEEIQEENVCTILNQSKIFGDNLLAEQCIEFMAPTVGTLIHSEAFLSLNQEALLHLLQSRNIVATENDLFHGCIAWARNKLIQTDMEPTDTRIREVLGPCLLQIRFCEMTPADFASDVGRNSDVLSLAEKNKIYCCMLTKSDADITSLTRLGFNLLPRTNIISFTRFPDHGTRFGWNQNAAEYLAFSVDKSILFYGIGLYAGEHDSIHDIVAELWKVKVSSPELLQKCESTVVSKKKTCISKIWMKVQCLEPENRYVIVISIRGSPTYYGSGVTNSGNKDGANFNMQNINAKIFQIGRWRGVQFCNASQQGQIPEILYAMNL